MSNKPTIVCLCGSTRFMEAFQEANLRETIAGKIVLSIGCNTKSDADLMAMGQLTTEAKAALDELHKRKIDLADEILVLNVVATSATQHGARWSMLTRKESPCAGLKMLMNLKTPMSLKMIASLFATHAKTQA